MKIWGKITGCSKDFQGKRRVIVKKATLSTMINILDKLIDYGWYDILWVADNK